MAAKTKKARSRDYAKVLKYHLPFLFFYIVHAYSYSYTIMGQYKHAFVDYVSWYAKTNFTPMHL